MNSSHMEGEAGKKKSRRKTKSVEKWGEGKRRGRFKIPKCYILYHLSVTSEEPNYVVYIP